MVNIAEQDSRRAALAAESITNRPKRPRSRGFNSSSPRELVIRYVLLFIVLAISIGLFLWQLSTALKSPSEDIYGAASGLIPQNPTVENFGAVNNAIPVMKYIGNSVIVAILVVAGNVIGCTMAGFALARLKFRGRNLVIGLILVTMVLPGEATIIAQFVTVKEIGLADTLLGVALPGMLSMINVLLMWNAFRGVPEEIDQAAIVDGANVWQRIRYIGFPAVKGTLAIVLIFAFIGTWDDFLWPLIVLNTPDNFTLTMGLQYLKGTFSNDPRLIAAGAMIAFIPIAIVFVLAQRWFFRGVGEGAVKG
ncbi:ABC-type sugar transport system, permease component [Renibacterium salmoninarum ATCC 33209]|uniref:ABC-type sugar transport system, permease component n=1 Tax=Renibacterium salmoninarum (strain ATCC 33209 / DSM 20767 / JCM 11484 / NBRC 15589 / NCIMB 2235) TaxID=288705 RepID=A9WNV1_RENSM|nr:carbohydrate ABC transporter permease [Renibacterium salmoninarum]ABY22737.1 ABC-type sugar transport system, permease component [Renibacterium salmoninarum ATCC 33209]